jgi:serine/threonine protein kinase
MNYLIMLLIGLQYLEVNNVMHRDLKPDNVLIDVLPNGLEILLITDFGLSKN